MQHAPLVAWAMHCLVTTLVRGHQPVQEDPLTLTGIMSGLLVNPVFVARFYSSFGGANGTTDAVNSSIIGISVACLQLTAALGSLIAGRLGDIIGRKKCVRIGGFIYFF